MSKEKIELQNSAKKQFMFVVVLWGDDFRKLFLKLCLPSLLAPGNIPAISNQFGKRFLICTTAQDQLAIEKDPDFLSLIDHIPVEFIRINNPETTSNKYKIMSDGHKMATEKVYNERGFGVFLTPDLVLSNGTITTLQKLISQRKSVVLSAAMRFSSDRLIPTLLKLRKAEGKPLVIEHDFLVDLALKSLHPETKRYDFESPIFAEIPNSIFWRMPKEDGLIIHGFNWAPLLIDYSKAEFHDVTTFENWTMDGDYIDRNFHGREDLHVITDTKDALLISFTPENDLPYNLYPSSFLPKWYKTTPFFGYLWKVAKIRRIIQSGFADKTKASLLPTAVVMAKSTAASTDVEAVRKKALPTITTALRAETPFEKLSLFFLYALMRSRFWPISKLNEEKALTPVKNGTTFMNQEGEKTERVINLSDELPLGKWYWEVHSENLSLDKGRIAHTASFGFYSQYNSSTIQLGLSRNSVGFRGDGVLFVENKPSKKSHPNTLKRIISIAIDTTRKEFWIGIDGEWFGGGHPSIGTNPQRYSFTGAPIAAVSSLHGTAGTAQLTACMSKDLAEFNAPKGFSFYCR